LELRRSRRRQDGPNGVRFERPGYRLLAASMVAACRQVYHLSNRIGMRNERLRAARGFLPHASPLDSSPRRSTNSQNHGYRIARPRPAHGDHLRLAATAEQIEP